MMKQVEYINQSDELRAAMNKAGLTQEGFARELRGFGQRASRQAVWKWLSNKNKTGIPGYVGLYFYSKYGIHKQNIRQ